MPPFRRGRRQEDAADHRAVGQDVVAFEVRPVGARLRINRDI
jgi:hypothetical protein